MCEFPFCATPNLHDMTACFTEGKNTQFPRVCRNQTTSLSIFADRVAQVEATRDKEWVSTSHEGTHGWSAWFKSSQKSKTMHPTPWVSAYQKDQFSRPFYDDILSVLRPACFDKRRPPPKQIRQQTLPGNWSRARKNTQFHPCRLSGKIFWVVQALKGPISN